MSKSLLPPNASQLERAASDAARIDDLDLKPVSNLWNPWECHFSVLPYLAWALSVDVWDEDWPEKVKRQVIAKSIALHWIKGTPGAVELMCAALDYDVRVLEWHEYDGSHDRYKLQIKERMTTQDYENIVTADHVAKRQSQERDAIQIRQQREGTIYMGGIVYRGRRSTIYPHFELTGSEGSMNFIGAIRFARRRKVYPAECKPITPEPTTLYMGGVMRISRRRSLRSV
ncbi:MULTISPECIES: phage tail protein I [unclassified Maridesulfovibrio]|uniref:phage tail protein I n=1 Tax=unclassified Maridesulfovibrio TaxID=2794999 RepID=UPI003B412CA6